MKLPPHIPYFYIGQQILASMNPEDRARCAAGMVELEKQRVEHLHRREFEGYLSTYAGHESLPPLISILPMLSDEEYWKLIPIVWTQVEIVEPNKKTWLRLLQSKRAGREFLMTDADRIGLAALPDEIKIWRGCGHRLGVRGMSWTIDKSRAEFFAGYSCGSRRGLMAGLSGTDPTLAAATCRKSDVLAYFTGREESEIVLNPARLYAVKIERLPRAVCARFCGLTPP